MTVLLDWQDREAIRELIDLYGHIIDERAFGQANKIFTPDARYDVTDFGMGVVEGLAGIVALWNDPAAPHPLAHHATNILLEPETLERVRVRSKGIGVRADGRTGSVTYIDMAVKGAEGWRLAERIALLRRPTPPS